MHTIPLYQPCLEGNEKKYINECIDSTWISSKGSFVKQFENNFAQYTSSKYSVTACNGTAAIHLALLALNIGSGDEVIVPTLTYIASVNSISYTGAEPVFVDSLETTWQMDPQDIINKITPKTKAILVVHLYGHPCEMDEIVKIAKKYNLFIIEDCAEALGTLYNKKHVGSFGDVAAYSFFGNKTITTGEGGMVTTNNNDINKRVIHYKGQGLVNGKEYWHDLIGYNYRMTNICAALGLAQLERIDEFLSKKRQRANWYQKKLKNLPLSFHLESNNSKHSYWMVSILVNEHQERNALRQFLKENNIETRPLFPPIHTMPMYNKNQKFKIAESLSQRGINLPSWPGLKEEDVTHISNVIKKFYA